jgi:hypothetical protein
MSHTQEVYLPASQHGFKIQVTPEGKVQGDVVVVFCTDSPCAVEYCLTIHCREGWKLVSNGGRISAPATWWQAPLKERPKPEESRAADIARRKPRAPVAPKKGRKPK